MYVRLPNPNSNHDTASCKVMEINSLDKLLTFIAAQPYKTVTIKLVENLVYVTPMGRNEMPSFLDGAVHNISEE